MSTFHKPNGIFLVQGKDVKKGKRLRDLSIVDLAPTVLHLLGCRIPKHMDGKPILDFLADDSRKQVSYEAGAAKGVETGKRTSRTPEEEEAVRRALERLGYL